MTQTLSARDVQKRTHRRLDTVLDWLRSGALPAQRSGRRWLILESDLEQFLRDRARAETEARRQAAAV